MEKYRATLKQLLLLALPIVFANLINASSSLISMFFIAKINPEALAAGAIITSTYGLLIMMVISILYSVSILVGQMHGSGRTNELSAVLFSGIGVAFLVGTPLTGLLLVMTPILQLLHQPIKLCEIAGQYFQGIAYGFIPSLMVAVFTQFFMGISKPKLLFYFTCFGVVLNSVLSYFLIFGFDALQPMGIFGAGLATSLTSCVSLILILLYVCWHPEFKKYQIVSKNTVRLTYSKLLLTIGLPISIQYTLELLVFSVITYLMGVLGTNALGAQQIALQCSMVAIMIVMGISQSGSLLISQSIGKGTTSDRALIINCTYIVGGLCALVIGIIYGAYPETLIALYLDVKNPSLTEMVSLAQTILLIAAVTQLFDAGRNIAAGLLRGYGDTKSSMWTSLTSCWLLGLPLALLFGFYFHLGAIGLRLGIMLGLLFGCIHLMHKVVVKNKTKTVTPLYPTNTELS